MKKDTLKIMHSRADHYICITQVESRHTRRSQTSLEHTASLQGSWETDKLSHKRERDTQSFWCIIHLELTSKGCCPCLSPL